jgi:hypothetical protein
MAKLKAPKFKTLDEEMNFYANVDLYGESRELSPAEEKALDRALGIRRRKTTLTTKKANRKAS